MSNVIAPNQHEWSSELLFSKAQNYFVIMHEKTHDDWQFGLWSSLGLEILIRATLASKSITLLADLKDYNNLLYALNINAHRQKFVPKSISISDAVNILQQIFPNFTREMKDFCLIQINKRNSELHSGNLEFQNLSTISWLPQFYWVCQELCTCMGKELNDLFEKDIASEAIKFIKEFNDVNAKQIQKLISSHKTIWDDKNQVEQEELKQKSKILMNKHYGHRVDCPSCQNIALISGETIGKPFVEIADDTIIEKTTKKPSQFECIACGLKILGYSKLLHCQLGDTYTETIIYTPEEYFEFQPESDIERMGFFDDNNEY